MDEHAPAPIEEGRLADEALWHLAQRRADALRDDRPWFAETHKTDITDVQVVPVRFTPGVLL